MKQNDKITQNEEEKISSLGLVSSSGSNPTFSKTDSKVVDNSQDEEDPDETFMS